MKKIILTFFFSTICLISFSQLLVENFEYEQSELLTAHGWFTQYGAASVATVSSGLSFENYAESNIGNAAILDFKDSNQLHKSFTQVTSGNVYVAFMFAPIAVGKSGWFFSLRDNKFDNTNFNFNGRIFISESNKIGLTFADNQKKVESDDILDQSLTYLVVLKYVINNGENNDEVSLYVFDEFPNAEPSKPTIGPLADGAKVDISPANIVLRGYDNDNWLVIDGIRVATTWDEAVKRAKDLAIKNRFEMQNCISVNENGVKISLTEPTKNVAIFDILGKKITKEGLYLPAGEHNFSLKQGIYVVKIEQFTKKIVVK